MSRDLLLVHAGAGGILPPDAVSGLAAWYHAGQSVYVDGAVQLEPAKKQYLTAGTPAGLNTGDIDIWAACWVWADDATADSVMGRWNTPSNQRGWLLYMAPTLKPSFNVGDGGLNQKGAATWASAISTGAWHFLVGYHDATNNEVGISVDGAAFVTSGTTGTMGNSAYDFLIGARGILGYYWSGRIDGACFGKNPTSEMRTLATSIRDSLYASGAGKCYADLTSQEKTAWGLVGFWNLDEGSGARVDAHGGFDLTPGSVGSLGMPGRNAGIGKQTAAGDGDVLSSWNDLSGNANHLTQGTWAKRPVLRAGANGIGGCRALEFDGTDDVLTAVDQASLRSQNAKTLFLVSKATAGTTSRSWVGKGTSDANEELRVELLYAAGQDYVYLDVGDGSGPFLQVANAGLRGTPHVLVVRQDTQGGVTALSVYLNGANLGGVTNNPGNTPNPGAANALYLGAAPGEANFFQGLIAELAYYTRALSVGEIGGVTSYFKAKYGI